MLMVIPFVSYTTVDSVLAVPAMNCWQMTSDPPPPVVVIWLMGAAPEMVAVNLGVRPKIVA